MEIYRIDLFSKNNKKTGHYLYTPIVKDGDAYFWCKSIITDKPITKNDLNIQDLTIKREIPREYYKANKIKE